MMRVVASASFVRTVGGGNRLVAVSPAKTNSRYFMTISIPLMNTATLTTPKNNSSSSRSSSRDPTQRQSHSNASLPSASNNNSNNNNKMIWNKSTSNQNHHQHHNRMKANVLFAVAAVVSLRPLMTMAEGRTRTQASVDDEDDTDPTSNAPKKLFYRNGQPCPEYGCPLFPVDIVAIPPSDPKHNGLHAPTTLQSLAEIRNKTRQELFEYKETLWTLETTATNDMATMTMTGYKGGPLPTQINQDRALVVGPYIVMNHPSSQSKSQSTPIQGRLLGVFDGHATRGELVSEYVAKELPRMLAKKLREAFAAETVAAATTGPEQDNAEIAITKSVLHETFVELDRTAPAGNGGGCTASVVLLQGDHIYVANAGDSQSLIGVYRKKSQSTTIAYASREDKPNLPDERARVEESGGYVYVPVRGTSRVVWVNPLTGAQTGLAMSRSIGDWAFGKIGVVPDPIVDVLSISELVQQEIQRSRRAELSECWTVDDDGVVSRSTDHDSEECRLQMEPPSHSQDDDDVYIFAISATDGMLDYVSKQGMAQVVAQSLFEDLAPHPATACELLVSTAAQGWEKYRQGRYRDDIAIAVSVMRVPPVASKDAETDSESTATKTTTTSTTSQSQSDEL